ncbi:MAG TPA: VacJ family lipoprotein [Rhodospirillales bacterium]|nr:VacJ family lipoprotein [Rhodospirillales bacterium]
MAVLTTVKTGGGVLLVAALGFLTLSTPSWAGEDVAKSAAEATAPEDKNKVDDPFEGINRFTSGFNRIARKVVLDPLVDGYKAITPDPIEKGVSRAISNLTEPITAVSSLLQGDTENAGTATQRFLVNTTIGLGGTQDPATDMGLKHRQEDLGQAAGADGAAPGPHIVLPLFGPSNVRDAAGDIITGIANPLGVIQAVDSANSYAKNKDEISGATDSALDPYIVERDAYEQHRKFLIRNGKEEKKSEQDFPSISSD